MSIYFAHTHEADDETQSLKEHLSNVAQLAVQSGRAMGGSDLSQVAQRAALLHDAGKYSARFQRRIRGSGEKAVHSSAGAYSAVCQYGKVLGRFLSYLICGHHGGLPDFMNEDGEGLAKRLEQAAVDGDVADALQAYAQEFTDLPAPAPPKLGRTKLPGFSLSMAVRMCFSLLVDADFLDTERFCKPEAAALRGSAPSLAEASERFFRHIEGKFPRGQETGINRIRSQIYRWCLDAAEQPRGVFSLTVPTGGGKTLSSLAFGLRHAGMHGLRRVIYAIPYTSIIEQNADVFRMACGGDAVLEHHSNLDLSDGDESGGDQRRLASENWDSPIVVTTNVQLFESLFSNKPSRCRKLHNIAGSVIVLDEAQMIPDEFLRPCLAALQALQRDYGCTVLLCTATQPALDAVWPEPQQVREIVPDPAALYDALRRVRVGNAGTLDQEGVAQRMSRLDQVLCIVNTRAAARSIFEMLPNEGRYHLSTLMCAQHRTAVLKEIRERLKQGLPCRVVSTMLIEAGVDVSFPVVYRAAAGLDSIAQAAGRCNREGKLASGEVWVFQPQEGVPPTQAARGGLGMQLLQECDDVLGRDAIARYFRQRYRDGGMEALDREGILRMFGNDAARSLEFPFESAARAFRFIDSPTVDVLIPYDDACRATLAEAERSGHPAHYMRRLQRYIVGLYPNQYRELAQRGYLRTGALPCAVLTASDEAFPSVYSDQTGLCVSPDMPTLNI